MNYSTKDGEFKLLIDFLVDLKEDNVPKYTKHRINVAILTYLNKLSKVDGKLTVLHASVKAEINAFSKNTASLPMKPAEESGEK